MSEPLIFSKKDRKNIISTRRLKMTVKLTIRRSQLDKMTLGEIRKLKSDASKALNTITSSQIRNALKTISVPTLEIDVSLDPWRGEY